MSACRRGLHELTPDNIRPGSQSCRACGQEWERRKYWSNPVWAMRKNLGKNKRRREAATVRDTKSLRRLNGKAG